MKINILVFVVAVLLASCGSKKAYEYNQMIAEAEQSLTKDIEKTEKQVGEYYREQNYEGMASAATKMEKKVNAQLKKIKETEAPDVEEGDNLKKAAVKYFSYLKSIYTGYRKIGEAETDEDRQKELNNLTELTAKKDDVLAAMQKAQKRYAKANKMKMKLDETATEDGETTDEEPAPKKKKKPADEEVTEEES